MHFFFYRELDGRLRLRRYVSAALGILGMLAGMALLGRAQRNPVREPAAQAFAEPPAGADPGPSPTPVPSPSPTAESCPEDPEYWDFTPIFPDDNYRRIEPACVYEGVARAAAWMLLERMGHTKPGAAEMLGFDWVPWEPIQSIHGFTNLKGPLDLQLLAEWPAHPEFRFWQVDEEGRPAVAIGLRGCYRLPAETAGVICVIALDRSPGASVSMLGDLAMAHHALHLPGSRTFHLLRYTGSGQWGLIGRLAGLSIEITGVDQMSAERVRVAERLGTVPWDPAWLLGTYEVAMEPLPADWRLYRMDEATVEAIGDALNAFVPASLGGSE